MQENEMTALKAQMNIFRQIRSKCPHAFNQLLSWQYGAAGMVKARMQLLNDRNFQGWCAGTSFRSLYDFFDTAHIFIGVEPTRPLIGAEETVLFNSFIRNDKEMVQERNSEGTRSLAELGIFIDAFEYYENYLQSQLVKKATDENIGE